MGKQRKGEQNRGEKGRKGRVERRGEYGGYSHRLRWREREGVGKEILRRGEEMRIIENGWD